MEQRWFTVQEAADYMRVAVYTVRGAIWSGRLPAAKLGKRLILDRMDCDRLLESMKRVEPAFG